MVTFMLTMFRSDLSMVYVGRVLSVYIHCLSVFTAGVAADACLFGVGWCFACGYCIYSFSGFSILIEFIHITICYIYLSSIHVRPADGIDLVGTEYIIPP